MTRSIGEIIVRDLQPISVVKDRGFIALVKTLDPCYQIPSRKKLMEGIINNMYEDCKAKVMATLQNENHVILTTDMWTSRSTEAYLTVYCHFINNWQMQEFMLETCHFSAQHTADNIRAELKRIAEEWGITQKELAGHRQRCEYGFCSAQGWVEALAMFCPYIKLGGQRCNKSIS